MTAKWSNKKKAAKKGKKVDEETGAERMSKKEEVSSESEEDLDEDEESSSRDIEQEIVENESAKKGLLDSDDSESDNSNNEEGEDGHGDNDNEGGQKAKPFSDENAKWLKPKQKKKFLSDEDEDDEGNPSEGEDSDEELLEVERQAQQLDAEMKQEEEEAAAEYQRTIAEGTSIYHLPTKDEWEDTQDRLVSPSELRSHIESILEVLADFKNRREEGRARKEYMDWLTQFASELYGYIPELIEYLLTMFSPVEGMEFIDASDKPRPLVIRTNTLKTRRKDLAAALMKRGVTLDPLAQWSKVGLKIVESPVPIGATPEYLSGQYMLQSAASMCPVLALDPQPKERVLDVSAAPGGKTSYIAQLMRNTGVVVANDIKVDRQKATVANLHRLGVHNAITCIHDGRKLGRKFPNRFDRILLDAPCSGLGVISRDPSVKVQRTVEELKKCAHLQKELILAAIDALKIYRPGKGESGTMVYSTCSVSVFENEEVVNYALQKRDIKIVETGLEFGNPGFIRYQQKRFHPSVALTRRFYPHVHNMDGFFVAKIIKLSDRRPEDTLDPVEGTQEGFEKVGRDSKEGGSDVSGANKKKDNKKRKISTDEPVDKKLVNPKLSFPPVKDQQKQKKQKTNAKMTKPRRKRAAQDA